jgi:hypothetical protein
MGGSGSGRNSGRPVIEQGLKLDLRSLRRRGLFKADGSALSYYAALTFINARIIGREKMSGQKKPTGNPNLGRRQAVFGLAAMTVATSNGETAMAQNIQLQDWMSDITDGVEKAMSEAERAARRLLATSPTTGNSPTSDIENWNRLLSDISNYLSSQDSQKQAQLRGENPAAFARMGLPEDEFIGEGTA